MSQETEALSNWKTKVLIIGAVLGALFGIGSAYLFIRTATEKQGDARPEVSTGDAIKLGISVFGLVRGIASLADKN